MEQTRQASDEEVALVHLAWPGNSGEAQAKRAAALHLLRRYGTCSLMSNVAHAVREKCGGSLADLGVSVSFKQLLAGDPCFALVDGERPSDQNVKLRRHALAAATGQRMQQQQQQQPWQPSSSSSRRQPLASGPGSAEQAAIIARVQQTVAEFLQAREGCSATVEAAALHVLRALGGLKQLGISHKFTLLLKADASSFQLSCGPPPASPVVTLTPEAQQQLQQLQLKHPQPEAAAQSVAALLAHIAGRVWQDSSDSSPQLGVVRKALALAITCVANSGRPGTAAALLGKGRYQIWAPAAGVVIKNALACACAGESKSFTKLAQLLEASSPILVLKQTGESHHSVVLDIRGLLQEAAEAAEAAATAEPQSNQASSSASMVPPAAVAVSPPLTAANFPALPPAAAPLPPPPPPPAAAGTALPSQLDADAAAAALQAPQQQQQLFSIGALKSYIAHRCWDKKNPQLDLLLWRLSLGLVERANRGSFPLLPISQRQNDYRLPLREADGLLAETCRQEGWHDGSDPNSSMILTCESALLAAATNVACFSFVPDDAAQPADAPATCVQLNIGTLLREVQLLQQVRVG